MKKISLARPFEVIKIVVIALALGLGVGYVSANWTAPSFTAPNCPESEPACNPPINVSVATQNKAGTLGVGGLVVFGSANDGVWGTVLGGNTLIAAKSGAKSGKIYIQPAGQDTGAIAPGSVLVADDVWGGVKWGSASGASLNTRVISTTLTNPSSPRTSIEWCAWGSGTHPCEIQNCSRYNRNNTCKSINIPSYYVAEAKLACEAGEQATGGGFRNIVSSAQQHLSAPITDENGRSVGWQCFEVNSGRVYGECYAVCAQ